MDLSPQILEEVFQATRKVDRGIITLSKARDDLVRAYGFNPNSAKMSIRSLRHMFNGECYRRALTTDATDFFLNRIREEDGTSGLQKALTALSSHIDYRDPTGRKVPGLRRLLAKHSNL